MDVYMNILVFSIIIPIIIVYLLIILFKKGSDTDDIEYTDISKTNTIQMCPDLLIDSGGTFYLYNSKMPEIPSLNPMIFSSLDEYTLYTKWQDNYGIKCPVVYLKEIVNAQGIYVYKPFKSPYDMSEGVPDY
uniref:Uncharacterized protein n=1 Tax=viral metagenome TaxID=1070528 RepID=A0A6C0BTW4_9ZZZZ